MKLLQQDVERFMRQAAALRKRAAEVAEERLRLKLSSEDIARFRRQAEAFQRGEMIGFAEARARMLSIIARAMQGQRMSESDHEFLASDEAAAVALIAVATLACDRQKTAKVTKVN